MAVGGDAENDAHAGCCFDNDTHIKKQRSMTKQNLKLKNAAWAVLGQHVLSLIQRRISS